MNELDPKAAAALRSVIEDAFPLRREGLQRLAQSASPQASDMEARRERLVQAAAARACDITWHLATCEQPEVARRQLDRVARALSIAERALAIDPHQSLDVPRQLHGEMVSFSLYFRDVRVTGPMFKAEFVDADALLREIRSVVLETRAFYAGRHPSLRSSAVRSVLTKFAFDYEQVIGCPPTSTAADRERAESRFVRIARAVCRAAGIGMVRADLVKALDAYRRLARGEFDLDTLK